ncbi:hypothetical protein MHU86_21191 [Fragilaria crotonensis]|nr:hypothetical protein MHU86_21191 [Fragilaria crotonensis]
MVAAVERSRDRRNKERLVRADESDRSIIGESTRKQGPDGIIRPVNETGGGVRQHLSNDTRTYFHKPIKGPDDAFHTEEWFLTELKKVAAKVPITPKKSPVVFENTIDAATVNAKLLENSNFDVDKLLRQYADTTLGYGSEFRTVEQLKPLIGRHPHFTGLSQVLKFGMSYVFERELDPVTKADELQKLLARGNHKSAEEHADQVTKLINKDVTHGFVIPITIATVERIPNAAMQPLGLVHQWTLDAKGNRTDKYRLTQDLSFSSARSGPSRSINSRIDMSAYTEMIYGWCLPRILHYIVAVRLKFPSKIIFICKYDYSDAYRRIAHSASAASQTIAIHEGLAYLSLRLTFGGSPNPPTWCMFSEIVTDLANEISQCIEWNPVQTRSPAQPVAPPPTRIDGSIQLQPGKQMAVEIPLAESRVGRVDGFIDDLINVFVDTPDNCRMQPHVVPLAMHVTSRPHAGESEPITRRPLLSMPKLLAEGSPAEIQIVLGWRLDTRRMLISLPDDKFVAWSEDLGRLISQPRCRYHDLDQLVGRLNHSSFVLPISRHFMSRIRDVLSPRKHKNSMLTIGDEVRDDFKLWFDILTRANRGISINLIVTREPTRICWSDACPHGMGGYSLSGRAWRLKIPADHAVRGNASVNNLLEFTAMVVNIWLECIDAPQNDQPCILAIGDSTSAIGWLFKTSTLDLESGAHRAHLMVARHLASLMMNNDCCIASQHIKGEFNVVADLLSFAGESERGKRHPIAHDDPPDDVLTNRFLTILTEQVPENFKISPLPSEVLSWVMLVLQTAASSWTAAKSPAMKEPIGYGVVGRDLHDQLDSSTTPTSFCYPTTSRNFTPSPFCSVTETRIGPHPGTLQATVKNLWYRALCDKPQATWLRRFGVINGTAPCTSREARTCDPLSVPY